MIGEAFFPSETLGNINAVRPILKKNKAARNFNFDQNHGLTPLQSCKFFDYDEMTFL